MLLVNATALLAFAAVLAACYLPSEVPAEGACPELAPFYESNVSAPGYAVHFVDGVDPDRTTDELEQKYGFVAESIYALGFNADFSDSVRGSLRCEAVVTFVEQNSQPLPPPGARSDDYRG